MFSPLFVEIANHVLVMEGTVLFNLFSFAKSYTIQNKLLSFHVIYFIILRFILEMDKLKLGYFGDCSITCLISGGKRKLHCTYKDGKERVIIYND